MTESRYKIEYVLTNEGVKKSPLFKALWCLALIPLVLSLVIVINYEFSFKDMYSDSSVFLEKSKIYIFNLEDKQQLNTPEEQHDTLGDRSTSVVGITETAITPDKTIIAKLSKDTHKLSKQETDAKETEELSSKVPKEPTDKTVNAEVLTDLITQSKKNGSVEVKPKTTVDGGTEISTTVREEVELAETKAKVSAPTSTLKVDKANNADNGVGDVKNNAQTTTESSAVDDIIATMKALKKL